MISIVVIVLGLVIIILYAAATPGQPVRYIGVGVITAIAALVTGVLLGFLFGIPKVVSSGELRLNRAKPGAVVTTQTPDTTTTTTTVPPDATVVTAAEQPTGGGQPTDYPTTSNDSPAEAGVLITPRAANSFEPSTNLSEVSDWLTKLLLGAGLVELTHLGKPLGKLINSVAYGLGQTGLAGAPDHAAQVLAGALLLSYFVLGFLDGYVVTTLWYGSRVRHV